MKNIIETFVSASQVITYTPVGWFAIGVMAGVFELVRIITIGSGG